MIAASAIAGLEIADPALLLWSKVAQALSTSPTKGATFVGL
jgi:hypothetical protein